MAGSWYRRLWGVALCHVARHDWSHWEVRDPARPSERTCSRCGRKQSGATNGSNGPNGPDADMRAWPVVLAQRVNHAIGSLLPTRAFVVGAGDGNQSRTVSLGTGWSCADDQDLAGQPSFHPVRE